MFAPGQNQLTGSVTALQLAQYYGEVLMMNELGMEVAQHIPVKTVAQGSQWEMPIAGRALRGKAHTRGEDVLIDSGYVQTMPMTKRPMFLDDPFTQNACIPDWDDFQIHFDSRKIINGGLAEALARYTDFKAHRAIIGAARSDANIPVAGVTSGQQTFVGTSWHNVTTNTTNADLKNAAMNTDGSKLVLAITAAAMELDQKRCPKKGRIAVIRPSQYWALVLDRQLLDRDVVYKDNGDFAEGDVFKCAGIKLQSSVGLADAQVSYTADGGGADGWATQHKTTTAPGPTGGTYQSGVDLTNNAGYVFHPFAVRRLMRSPLEMLVYKQNSRWGWVTQMRVIDGIDIAEPAYSVELSLS